MRLFRPHSDVLEREPLLKVLQKLRILYRCSRLMQRHIRLVLQDVALGGDTTGEECFDKRVVGLSDHSNQLIKCL